MSRVGKNPVALPGNVKVSVADRLITVESGSNKLQFRHQPEVTVTVDDEAKQVVVERQDDERESKALHGTTRALIASMIQGVTAGFVKELEIVGVGWTAQVQGQQVNLKVGYADTKVVNFPAGVTVEVNGPRIKVSGPDKQAVGQVASDIRRQRKPEPYNGKGIKYIDEKITRKQGKAFGSG